MAGASMLAPYLPNTAEKISRQLNCKLYDFDTLTGFGQYPSGNKVTENPEILFARLDYEKDVKDKVEAIMEKQKAAYAAEQAAMGESPKDG